MEDEQGWKPNGRPQSIIALNFMSELDSLFRLDGGIDSLDKNVHEKKQAVSWQNQELEALEAKLRAAEDRLKQAKKNTPPRRKVSQHRTPVQAVFSDQHQTQAEKRHSPQATNSTPIQQDASEEYSSA